MPRPIVAAAFTFAVRWEKVCIARYMGFSQMRVSRPSIREYLLVLLGASEEHSLRCGTYDPRRPHKIWIRIIYVSTRIVHR